VSLGGLQRRHQVEHFAVFQWGFVQQYVQCRVLGHPAHLHDNLADNTKLK